LGKETESRLLKEKKDDLENKEDLLKEREITYKEQEAILKQLNEQNAQRDKRYKDLYNNYEELERKYNMRNTEFEVLSKTAERVQKLLEDREQENKLLMERLSIAEKGYEIEKQRSEDQKADYKTITNNLEAQIEDYKGDLERLRTYYAEAEKERNEAAEYKYNQVTNEYSERLDKKNKKIKELKNICNDKDNLKKSLFDDKESEREESSVLNDLEYISKKNAWRQLEYETQMLKTDIQAVVAPHDPFNLP